MSKEIILSNIIGINPTGTLDFNGTYQMNGTNDISHNSSSISKQNLEKAQTNQIICENFKNSEKNEYDIILLLLIVLIILILIKFYFYKKKSKLII